VPYGQAEVLLPLVDDVVRAAGVTPADLELVAVTTGPGSFTGIRAGLAAAHGIALARRLPLFGVTSFEAVAETVSPAALEGRVLLVALESRRTEFFVQLFDATGRALSPPMARRPGELAAVVAAAQTAIVVAGDAAVRAVASLSMAIPIVDAAAPVVGAARAAMRRWRCGAIGDAAPPLYLRSPDVTVAGGQVAPGDR
jgi:tRNA threonylcarbamoyladenosine biosynthesis protein TsaB